MNIDAFLYLDKLRSIMSTLPDVNEGTCFGTPAFYAGKKFFARIREEGDVLVIHTEEREEWIKIDPETFYITDHYKDYSSMLISLPLVTDAHLVTLITTAWSKRIGKKILKEWQLSANQTNKQPFNKKKG